MLFGHLQEILPENIRRGRGLVTKDLNWAAGDQSLHRGGIFVG